MRIVIIFIVLIILLIGGSFGALGIDFQEIISAYAAFLSAGGHIH